MSFQAFVQSVSGLVTAITLLLGAITAFFTARRSYLESTAAAAAQKGPPSPNGSLRGQLVVTFAGGVLLGMAITIFAARLLFPQPEPSARDDRTEPATVGIAQPVSGDVRVELDPGGSARFDVVGSSSGVPGKAQRRIYLLVHPEQPPAAGWWIQPDVVLEPSGKWSGVGWIGSKTFPTAAGHQFLIQAVVARDRDPMPVDNAGVPWIRSPGLLDPAATTNVVRLRVGDVAPITK